MDVKTAYTRTFLMLKEQPLHDESIKASYFAWWQNVRESYQARSLRLTKQGLMMLEKIDLKTYNIKFNKFEIRLHYYKAIREHNQKKNEIEKEAENKQ